MNNKKALRKTGILGGTFDPIHNGHIQMALTAAKEYGLDEVWLMPNGSPPHKNDRLITAKPSERLAMTQLAIEDCRQEMGEKCPLVLCDYEIKRRRTSYSYETMSHLRSLYPYDELFFIMGADSFINVEKWYKGEELLAEFGFIVSSRPGYPEKELESKMKFYRMDYDTKIIRLMTKMPDISSTEIRETALAGESIRHLVPAVVEKYILMNGLYDDMLKNPRWKMDNY